MQDKTGLEDADGVSSLDADALFTSQIQRLRVMVYEYVTATFFGEAQPDAFFEEFVFPVDVYVEEVHLSAYAGAPDATLTLVLNVDGADQADSITLGANAPFSRTVLAGDGVLVEAGKSLKVKFSTVGSANPGVNVTARLKLKKSVVSVGGS